MAETGEERIGALTPLAYVRRTALSGAVTWWLGMA
jgi:hypothetical protein